jgi:hypothetical protein
VATPRLQVIGYRFVIIDKKQGKQETENKDNKGRGLGVAAHHVYLKIFLDGLAGKYAEQGQLIFFVHESPLIRADIPSSAGILVFMQNTYSAVD